MDDNIIRCQAIIRGWLSRKNNIYRTLKQPIIRERFESELNGFHLLHDEGVKESVWESINCNIVDGICTITDKASGNHLSGKDNRFNNWNISNKTAKLISNKRVSLSSYRLSQVCDKHNFSNIDAIKKEIQKRDESFDYYSMLTRKEDTKSNEIEYTWYVIPKNYYVFCVDTAPFTPKYRTKSSKHGKKDDVIGLVSKFCSIQFSMSSQLWFTFPVSFIEQFKIHSIVVHNHPSKLSYSDVYRVAQTRSSYTLESIIYT